MTGLTDFGFYMVKMLTVDALFLNEDRHTHNIAVLMDDAGDSLATQKISVFVFKL